MVKTSRANPSGHSHRQKPRGTSNANNDTAADHSSTADTAPATTAFNATKGLNAGNTPGRESGQAK